MAASVRPGRPRPRLVILVVLCLGLGAVLASCGDDGDEEASDTTAAATTSGSVLTTSSTSSPSSTTVPTSTTSPSRDRWVGVTWEPDPTDVMKPAVDGATVGFSSVVGMCQGADCAFGLDLLTTAPVTGAPPPGPYLLWSSRAAGHREDGRPIWTVVDVADVTLAAGETTLVCSPVGDPATSALGIGSADLPEGGTVTPLRVFLAGADGAILTPDPAGYTCEVGQD